jgi:hypothetical protein
VTRAQDISTACVRVLNVDESALGFVSPQVRDVGPELMFAL